MKLVVDTHTHTVSSGHAYSTVQEMAQGARANGIHMFAVTDHGPGMQGAPHLYHFGNLKVLPGEMYGVRVIKGVEANIMSYDGQIDVPAEYLKRLELVLASFHDICIRPGSVEEHTRAMERVLENPYVDAVAHPGCSTFQVDIERVVLAAAKNKKRIEINNHSFSIRPGSEQNCREFALQCIKHRVGVLCGSDSHISFDVGSFERVKALFDEVGMPEELVINTSVQRMEDYLTDKKQRLGLKV